MTDTLQKFITEDGAVRGELVDVSAAWRQVQARHDYPPAVRALLGEMLAATALLSANLKFNGAIIMQIHGDGPVRLLVVECDAELHMRATAKLAPDAAVEDGAGIAQLINLHGHGRFAITLDPRDKLPGQQPYQGIVPLNGDSVAEVIEHYMLRSEQLDTRLWLAADADHARGMLLQRMPDGGGQAPEAATDTWERLTMLAATVKRDELLATDVDTLRHRLFWEETIRLFEPLRPQFRCSCSRDKVAGMLKMLGQDEVQSALDELGQLGIDCDFCGQHYEFDKVDCAQLFASEAPLPAPDARH
ncbi:MAG: Hsp33 family molecular chaperone HslO [Burkholderiaceae bacterium]